jgi:hypothetical protein
MDAENDDSLESRPPTGDDLIELCRNLNAQQAKYIIVGGFAVIQQGFTRATEDIDLLLEASQENQLRVRKALESLPDQAVLELAENDLNEFLVVRVADEFVVDLMLKTCGLSYEEARAGVEFHNLRGVSIPFASAPLLLRMKQTYRAKDELDRIYLKSKLGR